jgi:adenine-specific DNA-methyltransferase
MAETDQLRLFARHADPTAIRLDSYRRPMSMGEHAVQDLVETVREAARTDSLEARRRGFRRELDRVAAELDVDRAAWEPWADGVDVIGAAYEQLVSGVERRPRGQFQTPFWAADLMASWLLAEPAELLLDPGVGAGRLLFRALKAGRHLPEKMIGLDVDPLSLTMARLNVELRDPDGRAQISLRRRDFLTGSLTERPDAITCNPPYSRHHSIPPEQKEAIHAGFESRLGQRFNRLAGLHVLFLVRALEVARPGARIAFIAPADWLDVGYGRSIKRFVLEQAYVESIVLFDEGHLFFDGAMTSAAITFIRKEPSAGRATRIVRLPRELPPRQQVLAAVKGTSAVLIGEEVELAGERRWGRLHKQTKEGTRLGEVARVRRGLATGCNRFFSLSEKTRKRFGIDKADLRSAIVSPRLVSGTELTRSFLEALPDDQPRWVLDRRDAEAEKDRTPIARYLRWGRKHLNADSGYLASNRKPWYALEKRGDCPILFSYMNRANPRFIRNRARAVPLNTFLIVEPEDGIDPDELCAALNSQFVLDQLTHDRRNYGGGLWKLEPREVEELKVELL